MGCTLACTFWTSLTFFGFCFGPLPLPAGIVTGCCDIKSTVILLPASSFISTVYYHNIRPLPHTFTQLSTHLTSTLSPILRLHPTSSLLYPTGVLLRTHSFHNRTEQEKGSRTLSTGVFFLFCPYQTGELFHPRELNFGFLFAMHNAPRTLPTPPSTPPPQAHPQSRCLPPTPESRIGIFLGRSLELKGILGTGAYGVVYSAIDHLTQTWYAVKALSKTNANGEPLDRRQREFQSREIQLHYHASAHPNIVSMLKIVDDPDCTYVVLEYCPEGDLFSNITERGRYVGNDTEVQRAFLQILDAVEHCHRLGIYHRDLKPENILVSNGGDSVLLADFGLATTDSESEDHGCGSTFYMSPGRLPCLLLPPPFTH